MFSCTYDSYCFLLLTVLSKFFLLFVQVSLNMKTTFFKPFLCWFIGFSVSRLVHTVQQKHTKAPSTKHTPNYRVINYSVATNPVLRKMQ